MIVVSKVTPITQLKILRGVRINPSSLDFMTFASESARDNYFSAKSKYSYNNAVPVRDNTFRLPVAVDMIFDCGYVMWQNANFNNKWFYGFIINKTWINVNCCEIEIQIDVITTWEFNWTLHPSYIVRMHTLDDGIGDNIEPEPSINTSLKVCNTVDKTDYGIDSGIGAVIWYMPKDGEIPGTSPERLNAGGVFCACNRVYYPKEDWERMYEEIIHPLAQDGLLDNIIAIQMVPDKFFRGGTGTTPFGDKDSYYYQSSIERNRFETSIDGYTPANKKLLTFPYNSLVVSSSDGVQNEYALELFSRTPEDAKLYYNVYCTFSLAPVIVMQMVNYGHRSSTGSYVSSPSPSGFNVIKNFPLGFWSGLSGLGYVQNMVTSMFTKTRDFLIDFSEQSPDPKMSGFGQKADQTLARLGAGLFGLGGEKLPSVPLLPSVKSQGTRTGGSLPSGATLYNLCFANFYFEQKCITHLEAARADRMLTRWGYSYNTVTIPRINGRQKFNYIQTRDLLISGDIPQDHLAAIQEIFDRGVTFWHNERGYEIGSWDGAANTNPIV